MSSKTGWSHRRSDYGGAGNATDIKDIRITANVNRQMLHRWWNYAGMSRHPHSKRTISRSKGRRPWHAGLEITYGPCNPGPTMNSILTLDPASFEPLALALSCPTTVSSPKHSRNNHVCSKQHLWDMTTDADGEDPKNSVQKNQGYGFINGWKSLFSFTAKSHLPVLLPAIFMSTAAGTLQPTMAFFFGKFFDSFSDFASGKVDGAIFMSRTLTSFHAMFAIGAATFLFKGALFILWLVFGELQARCVRELLFTSLLDRDMGWYEARTSGVGTLLTRIQSQIRDLQLGTSQPLGLTIVCIVQGLAGLGLALRTNWKLALVVLSALPVIAIGATIISRGLQANINQQTEESANASRIASNCIKNIVTVKCFNAQEKEAGSYTTASRSAAAFAIKQAFSSALQVGFVRFAATAMFVQGFWYGGTQVHASRTTAGEVVTTFWGCLIAAKAFEDMLPHGVIIQKSQVSAAALQAILYKVGQGELEPRRVDGLSPQFCEGDIEMREVSFAYPSTPNRLALDSCTLYFRAGETTFVVGKSGSGKSTLGNLLMGFYRPQSGSIVIDDNEIQCIDTRWLRNNITLVQQDSILFSDTVFRNIALGCRDYDRVTSTQMDKCIHVAALNNTISKLSDGVHTRVGTGGSSLSGGQKQRVVLARARLRDTPILILDEATSALDNTSKILVMHSIRNWRRGRTTIIITHDLSQLRDEDFVYVLQRGRVVQEGQCKSLANIVGEPTDRKADSRGFETRRLDGSENVPGQSSEARHADRPPAMSSDPVRRDSFDFLTRGSAEAYSADSQDDPYSDRIPGRARKGVLINNVGAINLLKRQSVARAKVMYALHQRQSYGTQSTANVPVKRTLRSATVAAHNSIFSPRMPRTPISRDKPLPIPLPQYEMLQEGGHIEDSILESAVEQPEARPQSTFSIQAVLLTLWPCLDKSNRSKLLLGFLATLGHAGASPAFSYALVQVFNTYYMPTGYQRKALVWSMAVIGIAVGDGVACFFMQYLLDSASQAWVDTLRLQALRRIVRQPKGWFDDEQNNPTTLVSAFDKTGEEVKNLVGRFAAQILVVAVMMVVAVIWALLNCWKITVVSLAASPVLYVLAKCFEVVSAHWESRSNSLGEAVNQVFADAFADIKTVRSLTLEPYFHIKFRDAARSCFSVGIRRAMYTGLFFGLSDSAIAFFTPMIFWYGSYLAKDGEWPVKSILTVFGLLLFCTANANAVIAFIPQTSSAADTASRLIRLARMPVDSHEEIGQVQLDRNNPATLSGPIHFINLTFKYPSRPGVPALRRLNLTIPAGRITAIVGASGSGKSTITSLLLGLYPPTSDHRYSTTWNDVLDDPPSLTLSGRDIRTLDLNTLRSLIALVPQTPVLLPITVRENITYGLPSSSLSTSELASSIDSAARAAGIHDFIVSLPEGYATLVGDGGLSVSGGQAQRIVIARALIRDPKILILDEATSALDHESAGLIRQSILKLVHEGKRKGKPLTVIVVTHGREMMEFADNVVVMDQGAVVEQGGFDELMALEGRGKLWAMLNAGDH
ncbi:hypothetical protein PV04_00169 [Phialophora macrospora]|uniref:Uncharacterized protein n=1 Tax=Phialophora macrospora TaxID=1851006 RepID=A0A0D2FU11_9EURO|nr:hypothetical protein PV04_00169 [Phialophora macrospora]